MTPTNLTDANIYLSFRDKALKYGFDSTTISSPTNPDEKDLSNISALEKALLESLQTSHLLLEPSLVKSLILDDEEINRGIEKTTYLHYMANYYVKIGLYFRLIRSKKNIKSCKIKEILLEAFDVAKDVKIKIHNNRLSTKRGFRVDKGINYNTIRSYVYYLDKEDMLKAIKQRFKIDKIEFYDQNDKA